MVLHISNNTNLKSYKDTRTRATSLNKKLIAILEEHNYTELGYRIYRNKYSYDRCNLNSVSIVLNSEPNEYRGDDLALLENPETRFPWQNQLLRMIYDESRESFKVADDRSIIWIQDDKGCSGKSKYVKWLSVNRPEEVAKISFGTTNQLRSGLVSCGPRLVYFIDIPRTLGSEDSIQNLITVMYGRYKQLLDV